MKGELGILACPLLMMLCVVVLSLVSGVDTEGATTYIDGDWYIQDDTTLSDGTWAVNGSVIVVGCNLTLDGAELVLNRTMYTISGLSVASDASLTTRNSEVWGNSSGIYLDIRGDTHLDNTSIRNVIYSSSGALQHNGGDLTLDHVQLSGGYIAVMSRGNLTVRGCQFTDIQYGIRWSSSALSTGYTVVIKDSTFVNDFGSYSGYAIDVSQGGSSSEDSSVYITGCYFNGLNLAMVVANFEDSGNLLIEGNRVENCSNGLNMEQVGPRGTVRHNQWSVSTSGSAVRMDTSDRGSPDINNETMSGGSYAFYMTGSYDRVALRDVDVTGVTYGLYVYSGYVDIYDSTFRTSSYNFRISRGYIHLHRCDHQYTASVGSYYGEVSEPVIVNVTQVSWQEGTLIVEGVTQFENETGEYITERDNEYPFPVALATWMMTYRDNITIERVRGMYRKDGLEFRSAPFEVAGLSSMELVIIDNSTPEVEVSFPEEEDMFEALSLTLKGNFTERGAGMGRILLSHDGEEWLAATLFDEGKWQVRFPDLPNGILTFTVNISDRAGNSREATVANITIDTIWPFIQVKLPGKYVTSSPAQLVARTEPRARAFVNHQEVDVMPDGWFSALLPLYNSENEVHIRVVDVVGHENYTIIKVVLDTTAPALLVESPASGHWTNRETVTVTGTTEARCCVTINGVEADMEDQRFNVPVPLEEGMNLVTVTAEDEAGNQFSITLKVYMDTVPPQLDVQAPEEGTTTRLPRMTVTGSVTDDNVHRVLVNNLSADLLEGHFYREVTLVPGVNLITVVALDVAGNEVTEQMTVVADFETPIITARISTDGTTYMEYDGPLTVRENRVHVEVTTNEQVSLRVMGGTPIVTGPGRHTEEVYLEPGRNMISVQAEDLVGNQAETVTFVVYQDSIIPDLRVHAAKDVEYSKSEYFLVSGVTEPGCQVTVDGIPAPVTFNGTFALSIELDEGPNSVRVVAMDAVGNQAIQIIQVVYEPEEESQAISGWTSVIAGAVLGLLAGLLAALVVTRRRKDAPPPPPVEEEPSRKVAPEQPTEGSPAQEVPGQLPPDPQREHDEWEMM